jgi:TM2 domain-containing membrane protein YozV
MAKSVFLTYVLWLVGGFFGLHHLYLGRDAQAFLWWCTFGGYVGCGWFRDIFHIPEYVADANEDRKFMEKHVQRLRTHETVNSYVKLVSERIDVIYQVQYVVLHDPVPSLWPALCGTVLTMIIFILKVMYMYLLQR